MQIQVRNLKNKKVYDLREIIIGDDKKPLMVKYIIPITNEDGNVFLKTDILKKGEIEIIYLN